MAALERVSDHVKEPKAGRTAVVTTNNNDAYRAAIDLHNIGIKVAAVVDSRANPDAPLAAELEKLAIKLYTGKAVGAAKGTFDLQACLDEGLAAGSDAAAQAGFGGGDVGEGDHSYAIEPQWINPTPYNKPYKQFVDQQNDVKASDVALAAQET